MKRSLAPLPLKAKEWTALHFLGVIFVLAAVAVLMAILFAPDKPPPPPVSKTTYEPKPEAREEGLPPMPAPRPRGRREEPRAELASSEPVVEEGPGCIVQGVVLEAKTNKPVAFARVNAKVQEWWELVDAGKADNYERHKSTHTTRTGKYALRLPTPGKYFIGAWHNGYLYRGQGQEVELDEDDKTYTLNFTLDLGASISGRVTETGTGKPVGGMVIWAYGDNQGTSEGISGDDGRYTVSGLLPGGFTVTAQPRNNDRLDVNFAELSNLLGNARSFSSIQREVVISRENQEVTGIDFKVEPFGTVWGHVMTYDEEPVGSSGVVLCSSTTIIKQVLDMAVKQKAPITTNANHDGYYEMNGVPLNKEWRLFTFPHDHAPQLSEPFLLTTSQRVARIDIYVSPGSDIYGLVVDPDRKPIEGAALFCIPATSALLEPLSFSQTFEEDTSKEDGSFEFENIPKGDYQVYGTKKGFKYTTTGEPFYSDGQHKVTGLTVMLTPIEKGTLTIYGTVTDTSGQPLPGVEVELGGVGAESLGDEVGKEVTTDSDGQYAFYEINAGFYMLMARRDGYERKVVTDVKYDEPTDIVLDIATTISGRVLISETGEPPGYFSVRVLGAGGGSPLSLIESMEGRSFSTPDGSFTLTVKPGDYTLEARARGYTPGRASVSASQGSAVTGIVIEVTESGGSISGRVVTADGSDVGGAMLALNEAGDVPLAILNLGGQGSVQVGSDGEFEFKKLVEGTYSITARKEGYAPAMHGPITLGDGQTSSGNIIRLSRGNTLRGYVAFNGQLEPGAMVTVVGNGISEIATADANGQYEFNNLPAGSYVGSAVSLGNLTSGNFAPLHARIDVVEGQNNVYNFGEPTHTSLAVMCTPPPGPGKLGFALLLFPGAPADIVALNLTNPATWFQDSSEMATYVAGMSQIDRDGYFQMDNLIQGEFRLDILYTSLGEIMSGSVSMVYSGPVVIEQGQRNELLDLQVGAP